MDDLILVCSLGSENATVIMKVICEYSWFSWVYWCIVTRLACSVWLSQHIWCISKAYHQYSKGNTVHKLLNWIGDQNQCNDILRTLYVNIKLRSPFLLTAMMFPKWRGGVTSPLEPQYKLHRSGNLSLSCPVIGQPIPNVTWFKVQHYYYTIILIVYCIYM